MGDIVYKRGVKIGFIIGIVKNVEVKIYGRFVLLSIVIYIVGWNFKLFVEKGDLGLLVFWYLLLLEKDLLNVVVMV